jgi:hypothetical protein
MPPEDDRETESKIQRDDRKPINEDHRRDYREKKETEQSPRERDNDTRTRK